MFLTLLILPNNLAAQNQLDCVVATDYIELGQLQWENDDFEVALDSFNCALFFDDTDSIVYLYRAMIYLALDLPSNAIVDLTNAIEINNEIANYYSLRGGTYYLLQDYESANKDLVQAIGLDSSNPELYLLLALIYNELEEPEQAEEVLSQGVDINSDNAEMYAVRGFFYNKIEEYDKSVDDFATALEIDATIASSYIDKGVIQGANNFLESAITSYTIAILIEPEFVEAYLKRAIVYVKLEDIEHASEDIERAFDIDNDPSHYEFLAYAYYLHSDLSNSLTNFQIFLSLADEEDIDEFTLDIIKSLEEELDSE